MCTGDMAISLTIWSHEKGRVILNFEFDDTCRDYKALKQWVDAKDPADAETYPENAKQLHAAISKGTLAYQFYQRLQNRCCELRI